MRFRRRRSTGFTLEATDAGTDLVVTSDWSSEAEAALRERRADGLVLNYARGFRERDLEFLRSLPVRRLQLLARTMKDLSPIHDLGGTLISLSVQADPRALIELDRLPLLERLSAPWPQVIGSFRYAQNLQHVVLLSYAESDLAPLTTVAGLQTIVFKDRPAVETLRGFEDLPSLRRLSVQLATRLTDIRGLIDGPAKQLTSLELPSCKQVTDINAVAECRSLRSFDLSDGGNLPTAEPLRHLVELERLYLYGTTNVVSGDLGPIAALPKLRDFRMKHRPTYTPSVQSIEERIATS